MQKEVSCKKSRTVIDFVLGSSNKYKHKQEPDSYNPLYFKLEVINI